MCPRSTPVLFRLLPAGNQRLDVVFQQGVEVVMAVEFVDVADAGEINSHLDFPHSGSITHVNVDLFFLISSSTRIPTHFGSFLKKALLLRRHNLTQSFKHLFVIPGKLLNIHLFPKIQGDFPSEFFS